MRSGKVPAVELVIQVGPGVAAALLEREPAGAARTIVDRAAAHGVRLAGPHGPAPPSFLSAEVAGQESGEALARELRGLDGVVAAYVKPDVRPAR